MVIETEILSFLEWLPWAALKWALVVLGVAVAGLLLAFLATAVEHGPRIGLKRTWRGALSGVADLLRISPRRVWALTRLAIKESIRRRVVVVFAVFILVLAFAGLFLDPASPNPGRLYLSFVLTATSYLVLLLALFLSAFSLPLDIRWRTLHTVVTKPVRPSEIVLGRILGFSLIGTGLLALMALVSYGFVVQGLDHTHTLTADDLRVVGIGPAGLEQRKYYVGQTSSTRGHRHPVVIDPEGKAQVESAQGHWHEVTVSGSGADASYQVGPPRGILVARVPMYGKIRFRDEDGIDATQGINVGDEWTYRGYVAGGTPAAMIWTFDNVTPQRFADGLPMDMTLGVFRTHKGNIERGVLGSIGVRNPDTGLLVEVEVFESKEFDIARLFVPAKITRFAGAQVVPQRIEGPQGVELVPVQINPSLAEKREFDLFEDLVSGGRVEVWVRCLEAGQYFGGAQADLYLRAADAPFWLNFIKGYVGIWMQMVLVIGFGVMFSTFLSGSVAMIATLGALLGGLFSDFMVRLARGELYGGGPLEALYRLVLQENLMSDLPGGIWTKLLQMADTMMEFALRVISSILPAFGRFSYANYVAYGFDITPELLLMRLVSALAFLLPVFVAAHFFLKTREVAR